MKFSSTLTIAALAATVVAAPKPIKECKVAKHGGYQWHPESQPNGYPSAPKEDPSGPADEKEGDSHWDDYKDSKPAAPEQVKPAHGEDKPELVKPSDNSPHYWGDYDATKPEEEKEMDNDFDKEHKDKKFTSVWSIKSTPDQVVLANGTAAPGEPGSVGYWNFGINSETDLICWYILFKGTTGPYSSPARTATHIHEAAKGRGGPPRVVFPDPQPADSAADVDKVSKGCMTGPFTTGVITNGTDTGVGFTLKEIEQDPMAYYVDAHTVKYVPGVHRAQFA